MSLVKSGTVTVELEQSYDIVIPILHDTTKGNVWYQTRVWNNNKSITFASSTSGDSGIYHIWCEFT